MLLFLRMGKQVQARLILWKGLSIAWLMSLEESSLERSRIFLSIYRAVRMGR